MRERCARSAPGLTPLAGTAEAVPVPDASADAVVVGQAYHWFDRARAHPEIARVLKPGGVFAPIWNDRDENVSWVAEMAVIASGLAGSQGGPHAGPAEIPQWFGPVERARFQHSATHTVDSLVELVMSRSYYLVAPPERQASIVRAVRALAADHPDLDHQSTFQLPYQTWAYRTQRLPSPNRSSGSG